MDRDGWMHLLGLDDDEVPRLLVLEGTWWRQSALDARLPLLEDVRELGIPDLWHGWYGDLPVVYCPAYGAARAVEPVHVLGTCGTQNVAVVGSCGSLQEDVRIGEVVLSESALIGEGVSQYYGGEGSAPANLGRVARAASLLAAEDIYVHRGPTVTAETLLQQPPELLAQWRRAGHLSVDLESSAVFTAASHFAMRAVSVLYVHDQLPSRGWGAPFTREERAAQARGAAAVYDVALALA